jgi:DNA-binding CsgD family transcriptional regulator
VLIAISNAQGDFRAAKSGMQSRSYRKFVLDTIDEFSRLTLVPQVSSAFSRAVEKLGFTSLGINSLPPPGDGSDPIILTERVPEGFRDFYIEERFYLVDHLCAFARTTFEPFRYIDAPYDRANAAAHERFLQALETYDMRNGLVVPIGRPANMPACVWLTGKDPELNDDAKLAVQAIALFAASKGHALSRPADAAAFISKLTQRERDVLQWISAGKTSWEIGLIAGLSERAVNKIVGEAMIKLEAVTRTQAVVNAIRLGEIWL